MSDPNFEELLSSPYSNRDPDDGIEAPWKLPVAAAIVGALLMATFVIFSIVTAPDEELAASTTVAPDEASPVLATGLPPGYASVSDDVGMRVDVMRMDENSATLFVSSTVTSGTEPQSVPAVDVIGWTVRSAGTEPEMRYQHSSRTALGGVAVELRGAFDPEGTVFATLPGTTLEAEDRLTLPPDVPILVADHRIAVGDAALVVDELSIGNGYGSIRWHLEGGLAAKLDVTVVFDGVSFPLALVTPYNNSEEFGGSQGHLAPPWNPSGETTLLREGEPLSDSNVPTGITVTFSAAVVIDAGDEIEIPVGDVVTD